MNVTSTTQTQYTSNTNRVDQNKETQKEYESKNSPLADEKHHIEIVKWNKKQLGVL